MSAPGAQAVTPPPAERAGRDPGQQLVLLLGLQFVFGIAFSTFVLLPKILASNVHAGPGALGRVMSMFAYAGLGTALAIGGRGPGAPSPH